MVVTSAKTKTDAIHQAAAELPHLQSGYPLQEDSSAASLFHSFDLISVNAPSRCVGSLVGGTRVVEGDRGRETAWWNQEMKPPAAGYSSEVATVPTKARS